MHAVAFFSRRSDRLGYLDYPYSVLDSRRPDSHEDLTRNTVSLTLGSPILVLTNLVILDAGNHCNISDKEKESEPLLSICALLD